MDAQAMDLVPRVYEAATHPEAWDLLLEELARRMHGVNPSLFLASQAADASVLERAPSLDPAWRRAYDDHYHQIDVRRNALQRRPEGTVIAGHALVPNEVFVRSEFYNDFLKPQEQKPSGSSGPTTACASTAATSASRIRASRPRSTDS